MTNVRTLFQYGAGVLCVVLLHAVPVVAQPVAELLDAVKESIHQRVDYGYTVGLVVGLVDADGPRYYSYGRVAAASDRTPDENTVFEIGSITKVFTAILLADMAQRGEVALDDPIATYLPDSVHVPVRGEQPITLKHLATHTSGLPRLPINLNPADPANPYADYSVAQLYDFLSHYTLPRDAGAQYEYSNYGAGLLGHILARHADTSYEALVETRIADVLGLGDTRITLSPAMQERLAKGHNGSVEVANWDIPTLAGAGALRSTAHDMLAFLAANMGLVETPLRDALALSHEVQIDNPSGGMQVGLGWHVRPHGETATIWHNGGTGGYRSFTGFLQDGRKGVVVLTNATDSVDDLGFHLLDPSYPLRAIYKPVAVDSEVLDAYVGNYQLDSAFFITVTREGEQLMVQATGQPRLAIYPMSETEFFLKDVDARLTFNRSDGGTVESLTLHQNGQDMLGKKVE